jgi:hypothetical protein
LDIVHGAEQRLFGYWADPERVQITQPWVSEWSERNPGLRWIRK